MTLAATPDTIRAVAKVFQLAAILDDRVAQPDKARIAAWAAQVQRHRFAESDLLDGLQAFYDGASERAIQVGDLIHHARHAKGNRIDKEGDEHREARQEQLATKVDDDDAQVVTGIAFGPVINRTPRLIAAEAALQCTTTKAEAMAAIREFNAAKREAQGRRPMPSRESLMESRSA